MPMTPHFSREYSSQIQDPLDLKASMQALLLLLLLRLLPFVKPHASASGILHDLFSSVDAAVWTCRFKNAVHRDVAVSNALASPPRPLKHHPAQSLHAFPSIILRHCFCLLQFSFLL
jgi:hypothetical protein